jgi:enoyl-[acyl-carrier-protein] reductase (NADH)
MHSHTILIQQKTKTGTVAFLAMPVSNYITGQVVSVDGGYTINGLH